MALTDVLAPLLRWFGLSGPPAEGPAAGTEVVEPAPGRMPPVIEGRETPRGVRAGDVVASAYEAFQHEIHSFAKHATRDNETAAEVTQEAFLRLLREVGDRGAPDNVRAWLYRVASNMIVNRARRASVVERWRRVLGAVERVAESPETTMLRRERDEAVHAALSTLSRDARVGLLLAANGFSGREIAQALGRTEPAVRTMLCRARLQLRDQLADEPSRGLAKA